MTTTTATKTQKDETVDDGQMVMENGDSYDMGDVYRVGDRVIFIRDEFSWPHYGDTGTVVGIDNSQCTPVDVQFDEPEPNDPTATIACCMTKWLNHLND